MDEKTECKSMKTRLVGIITTMIFVVLIGGCSTNMKESVTLNDRQIDILLSEDLPTEWNKLTPNQQKSIQAIEEMLEYLENKYDKEFIYAGYKLPDMLEYDEESLLVYADGDNPKTDCFTVERTEDGFTDNYGIVTKAAEFQETLDESVKNVLHETPYKVISTVSEIDEDKGIARGVGYIFLNASDINDFDETMSKIENAVYQNAGYDQLAVYYVDGIDIASLTKEEWEQQLKTENIVDSKHSSARSWRNK